MKRSQRSRHVYVAAAVLSLAQFSEAQTSVTWALGSDGNWNVGTNWTGGVVPNNGTPSGTTYSVFIDGGQAYYCTVSINSAQSYTISQLGVSSGDRLNINAGGALTLAGGGTINNAGTIALGSVGSLNFNSSTVTLGGGGTITLNNSRLFGSGILHNIDNRIIGSGSFCNNAAGFVNGGTITITGASIIDPSLNEHFANTGLVEVSAGTLVLTGSNGGTFNNAGGSFTVQNGATLALQGSAVLNGGSLSTFGTGSIVVAAAGNGTLGNLTNLGNVTGLNGSNLYLVGTIENNGSITVAAGASATDLQVPGGLSLSGTGTLSLLASTANVTGGGTLTNGAMHTIRGAGDLGSNAVVFVNHGRIIADFSGSTLTLDPKYVDSAFINNGTLQATGGATLAFSGVNGGDFVGTGGRIEALNGSTVSLTASAKISGGTLVTSGTGGIVVAAAQSGTLETVTNLGHVVGLNGSNLYLVGTITNNGSISIMPVASYTDLEVPSATTLDGSGTVNLNSSLVRLTGDGTLTNGLQHTIRGVGDMGNNGVVIINNGMVLADVAAETLTLDPKYEVAGLTNNGTLQARSGGILSFTGSNGGDFVSTAGRIEALDGSTVSQMNSAKITGGTFASVGTGSIVLAASQGGTLEVITNLGHITGLNGSNLYLVGSITNNGSISITPGASSTDLEIPGEALLNGTGTLNLNSSLVRVAGGGTLTNGSGHTIRGIGELGNNGLAIINNGAIVQDMGSGILTINPSFDATGFIHSGLVRVGSGGTISLSGEYGGGFTGTGSYEVQAGAAIRTVSAATVAGGMIINNGTLLLGGESLDSSGISGAGITSLTVGTLAAGYIRQGTLSIAAGRSASIKPGGTIASTSRVETLTLTGTAKLDLNDNALVIDYTTTSPLATVRSSLTGGYNSGSWNGSGIFSSAARSDPSKALGYAEAAGVGISDTFRGQSFAGGDAVLVMYTLRGDTNLDRTVTSMDFNNFTGGYGAMDGAALWMAGDFDYNGKVNTIDFNWLSGNFGQTLPVAGEVTGALPGAVVPEPMALPVITVTLAALRRKRR